MKGDEIIVVSEPECGAKPTIYAAALAFNVSIKGPLKVHLRKALEEACVYHLKLEDSELDEVADELAHDKYAWIRERYLAEIVVLD